MTELRLGRFILLFLVFVSLFCALSWPICQAVTGEEKTAVQVAVFKKVYKYFRDNDVFFVDSDTTLNNALWAIAQKVEGQCRIDFPPPQLSGNEPDDFVIAENYFVKAITRNSFWAKDILSTAIKSMLKIDIYARIIAQNDYLSAVEEHMANYKGDAVEVVFDKYECKLIVALVIPNTPAAMAGFKVGDEVLKVNNVDFQDLRDEEDYKKRLKQLPAFPPLGAEITYEIKRENRLLVLKAVIIETKKKDLIFYRTIADGKIGFIKIQEFGEGCDKQFIDALDNLKKLKVNGLIIDLTDNRGGSVWECAVITKAMTGRAFKMNLSRKRERTLEVRDAIITGPQFIGPVAVLVNLHTASAAEILAACLQENGAAVIGTVTYGKNLLQEIILLPDNDYLALSTCWLKTLNNRSWPNGLYPTLVVNERKEAQKKAEEYLLNKMLGE